MPEFCTCGAQLPPDALFCHKCGKPQREVLAAEPEPEPVEIVIPPVPVATPPPQQTNFHNWIAVRTAFVFAPVALALSWIPAANFVVWVAAGFLAVIFYRRRTGVLLNVRGGVRLGWITGLIM